MQVSDKEAATVGALIITSTILVFPDYNYSITSPKTLFQFLRPLYMVREARGSTGSWDNMFQQNLGNLSTRLPDVAGLQLHTTTIGLKEVPLYPKPLGPKP